MTTYQHYRIKDGYFQAWKRTSVNEKLNRQTEILAFTNAVISTVRKISSSLQAFQSLRMMWLARHRVVLYDFSKRTGIQTNYTGIHGWTKKKSKTGLFRIFQESLTNITCTLAPVRYKLVWISEKSIDPPAGSRYGRGFNQEEIAAKNTGYPGIRHLMMKGDYTHQQCAG